MRGSLLIARLFKNTLPRPAPASCQFLDTSPCCIHSHSFDSVGRNFLNRFIVNSMQTTKRDDWRRLTNKRQEKVCVCVCSVNEMMCELSKGMARNGLARKVRMCVCVCFLCVPV